MIYDKQIPIDFARHYVNTTARRPVHARAILGLKHARCRKFGQTFAWPFLLLIYVELPRAFQPKARSHGPITALS